MEMMSSRNGVAHGLDQRARVAGFLRSAMETSSANAVGAKLAVNAA